MASLDGSVTALIGHINEIETRRRLVMMQLKEAEVKTQFAAEEHAALKKQVDVNSEKECGMKRELARVVDEQRQTQLQLLLMSDKVRQNEVEERLLENHAKSQLCAVEQRLSECAAEVAGAAAAKQQWFCGQSAAALLLAHRKELLERASSLQTEKETLAETVAQAKWAAAAALDELAAFRRRHGGRAAGAATADSSTEGRNHEARSTDVEVMTAATPSCPEELTDAGGGVGAFPDPAAADVSPALLALEQQIEEERFGLDEWKSQFSRQKQLVDRELVDLVARVGELTRWLEDARSATEATRRTLSAAQMCVAAQKCYPCCGAALAPGDT